METPRGPMAVMGPRGIRHWQQSTMGILAFSAEILHQKVQVSIGFGITGHLRGRCREVYQGDRKPKRRVCVCVVLLSSRYSTAHTLYDISPARWPGELWMPPSTACRALSSHQLSFKQVSRGTARGRWGKGVKIIKAETEKRRVRGTEEERNAEREKGPCASERKGRKKYAGSQIVRCLQGDVSRW